MLGELVLLCPALVRAQPRTPPAWERSAHAVVVVECLLDLLGFVCVQVGASSGCYVVAVAAVALIFDVRAGGSG